MFILCGVMLTNGIIVGITPFQFNLASGLLVEKNAPNRFLEKWLFPWENRYAASTKNTHDLGELCFFSFQNCIVGVYEKTNLQLCIQFGSWERDLYDNSQEMIQ